MQRDIYKRLLEWKNSDRRKPLVLNGARQVGKTYSLKHFGSVAYKNIAYLNFEKDAKIGSYFDGTLDPKLLLRMLSIHAEVDIEPEQTLVILDEIQECPNALNSLKYFCEESNNYHIVAAGSLLGVKMAGGKGFPVGKVNFLHMYPLSFFEFLEAVGQGKTRAFLEEYSTLDTPFPSPLHDKLLQFLKLYFYIGGMPEAVQEYVKSEKLSAVRQVHEEILDAYERDFAKHAPPHEIMKIITVWNQVHRQLAKENKKFIFAQIRKSARGREYEEAIQWLTDAGLIHKSHFVPTPKFPLSAYADNSAFKIFLMDVGLLGAQSDLSAQIILEGDLLFTEFKGALTENYVAQEWIATKQNGIYYWTSEGTAEIDFLIEDDHEIYPLEVKAGDNTKKKSLLSYNQKYTPSKLIRTTTMNLKVDGAIYNYPLYYISQLGKKAEGG